jgi:subtilase family serine protease
MFSVYSRQSLAALTVAVLMLASASNTFAQVLTHGPGAPPRPQIYRNTLQPPPRVQVSGNTFHVASCADAPAGYMRCHAHIVTDGRGVPINGLTMRPDASSPPPWKPAPPPAGYAPADLRSAYGVTGNGSAAMTVAIVDAYGYYNAESDLATYRKQWGLPACASSTGCFRQVNQNGGTSPMPADNLGWAEETALDLDMVSAMCPNCNILLVESSDASWSNMAIAVNTAAKMGAQVISNSFGSSESGSSGYEKNWNHGGVAIVVSTGDAGYGVEFPASSPHVTAVGGTSLKKSTSVARGWTETAWAGAGSGCSTLYAKPSWQKDPLCSKRTVADVSAVADPATGVAVFGPTSSSPSRGVWAVVGGTSVAAPLVAGIYGVNGGGVTYGSNPYANTGSINDVTSGSNGSCGGTYFCTAGAGYDGPTGLGTPKGSTAF